MSSSEDDPPRDPYFNFFPPAEGRGSVVVSSATQVPPTGLRDLSERPFFGQPRERQPPQQEQQLTPQEQQQARSRWPEPHEQRRCVPRYNQEDESLNQLSRNVTTFLRHRAAERGLPISEDGFLPLEYLLEARGVRELGPTVEAVCEVLRRKLGEIRHRRTGELRYDFSDDMSRIRVTRQVSRRQLRAQEEAASRGCLEFERRRQYLPPAGQGTIDVGSIDYQTSSLQPPAVTPQASSYEPPAAVAPQAAEREVQELKAQLAETRSTVTLSSAAPWQIFKEVSSSSEVSSSTSMPSSTTQGYVSCSTAATQQDSTGPTSAIQATCYQQPELSQPMVPPKGPKPPQRPPPPELLAARQAETEHVIREASSTEASGVREASSTETSGVREASSTEASGVREASSTEASGVIHEASEASISHMTASQTSTAQVFQINEPEQTTPEPCTLQAASSTSRGYWDESEAWDVGFDGTEYGEEYLSFQPGEMLVRIPNHPEEDDKWAFAYSRATHRHGWVPAEIFLRRQRVSDSAP